MKLTGKITYDLSNKEVSPQEFAQHCSKESDVIANQDGSWTVSSVTSDYFTTHPENINYVLKSRVDNYLCDATQQKLKNMWEQEKSHIAGLTTELKDKYGDAKGVLEQVKNNPVEKSNYISKKDVNEMLNRIHNSPWHISGFKNYEETTPISESTLTYRVPENVEWLRLYNEGQKFDSEKLPLNTVIAKQFSNALKAAALCSVYGHEKYKETDVDWQNFRKVQGGSETYANAAQRHNMTEGEDSESKLPHCFHKLWNTLAEVEMYIQENNIDIDQYAINRS